MSNLFRLLRADEIEVRAATSGESQKGAYASFLLYKDARVDQRILDETFGAMNWKVSYEEIKGRMYCSVSVWDAEKKEWISKSNVGVESNTEEVKGEASDALKRACFTWGLGVELYTAPEIFIWLDKDHYTTKNGKVYPAGLYVSAIAYDEQRRIEKLTLTWKTGGIAYKYEDGFWESPKPSGKAKPVANDNPPTPTYKPMDINAYWQIVKNYAEGVKSKSGADYREEWRKFTNAGRLELEQFDKDVENYKAGRV